MNIFVLDENPVQAAQWHCDRHVIKMILEHYQLMSHVLWEFDIPCRFIKSKAFVNHPCARWVRASYSNYSWLRSCTLELFAEKRRRMGGGHKLEIDFDYWCTKEVPINDIGITPFANCTPYKDMANVVSAYRLYYNRHKSYFAKWKNTDIPYWYSNELDLTDEYTRKKIFSLKRPNKEVQEVKRLWLETHSSPK